jgi:hypothetical protein
VLKAECAGFKEGTEPRVCLRQGRPLNSIWNKQCSTYSVSRGVDFVSSIPRHRDERVPAQERRVLARRVHQRDGLPGMHTSVRVIFLFAVRVLSLPRPAGVAEAFRFPARLDRTLTGAGCASAPW